MLLLLNLTELKKIKKKSRYASPKTGELTCSSEILGVNSKYCQTRNNAKANELTMNQYKYLNKVLIILFNCALSSKKCHSYTTH